MLRLSVCVLYMQMDSVGNKKKNYVQSIIRAATQAEELIAGHTSRANPVIHRGNAGRDVSERAHLIAVDRLVREGFLLTGEPRPQNKILWKPKG